MKTFRDYLIVCILGLMMWTMIFFAFDGVSSIQELKKEAYAVTAK